MKKVVAHGPLKWLGVSSIRAAVFRNVNGNRRASFAEVAQQQSAALGKGNGPLSSSRSESHVGSETQEQTPHGTHGTWPCVVLAVDRSRGTRWVAVRVGADCA